MLIFLLPRSGQRVSNAAARVRTLLRYVACSIISTVCVWEKKNMLRYLVKWEGSCLLADTDREIGGWKQTDTHVHTHTQGGGGGQSCPSLHCSHISEKRKNYFTHRLIMLCVRQKSLSESNLSRSARVAPDKQHAVPSRCSLLENTTSGWLTGGMAD